MTFSPRAIEAATQRAYEKFNENLIGCCEPTWSELADDVKQRLRDSIDAALTAALAVDGLALQGWQDISTAPKDGTEVLLASIQQVYNGASIPDRVTAGHWTTEEECREPIGDCGGECRCPEYKYHEPSWLSWDGGFTEENPPTHWQPLPQPPAASDREERK